MTLPERAISLTGPWWWFMLHLPPEHRKDVENRRAGFSHKAFRGPVWVHAAASLAKRDWYFATAFAHELGVPLDGMPSFLSMPRGGIVGRFTITDCLPPGSGRRWHMPGQWGFTVEDAQPCAFVPCKGALGFWRVPAPVLEQLRSSK